MDGFTENDFEWDEQNPFFEDTKHHTILQEFLSQVSRLPDTHPLHQQRIQCIRLPSFDLAPLLSLYHTCLTPELLETHFVPYSFFLVQELYGNRNLPKEIKTPTNHNTQQTLILQHIQQYLKTHPEAKTRIQTFIQSKGVSARLVNYFVVTYILTENPLSYYLHKQTYPYRIVGVLNQRNQPDILADIERGQHIVWINLHQEYKISKQLYGRRNLHAPYRRGISVQLADQEESLSLCEWNFYLWFDSVGGLDAFHLLLHDITQAKSMHNAKKRQRDATKPFGTHRKKKLLLHETTGSNYSTCVVQSHLSPPFWGTLDTTTSPEVTP
jgi:hypothetical protein